MSGDDVEEVHVEGACDAPTTEVGIDPYKVDVRIAGARLREEADEEPDASTSVFCYEARVVEMIEEEPLQ